MAKMSRTELKALLSDQKHSALSAVASSRLSSERSDALMYYNGDMTKDLPVQEGRSKAVSTDVADTVDGLMPGMMEIFAGSEEVVEFNPVGPEDVEAARQETDYINHVFTQQNPGFVVLYSFIKDALLSKLGVVKVWWEERQEEEYETYYDLTDDQFSMITADDEVEIVEHTEKPIPGAEMFPEGAQLPNLHDVKVTKAKKYAECKVLGVPPEEWGIEPTARSIKDSSYCFHQVLRTQDELIRQGYKRSQIEGLGTDDATSSTEHINRDSVDEGDSNVTDSNRAGRKIRITEHYIRCDYKGDGKACLYRVTTGGDADEILILDGSDDIVEFDVMPFAAMTPTIITHRLIGRSLADQVMDIQRIKTSLMRAQLDNAYLANNPRVEVADSHASDTTLDDLLVSRHGGIVRTKVPGGLNWQQVPTIGAHVFPLLEYMDQQREMRTGVSRQGQGLDPETLQDQSATAVTHMFTLAQAKMRLIARTLAETGIKDMFLLIHATIRKHGQQKQTVRLLNKWVEVDPRQWKKRTDMTINVGLGHGGRTEGMAMMNVIAMYQEKALLAGLTNLVTVDNLYNTAKDFAQLAGKKNVEAYFTNPAGQPPPQPKQDPKIVEAQIKAQQAQQQAQLDAQIERDKMQMQAQIEITQAQADIETDRQKIQLQAQLEERKFEFEREIALIEADLDRQMKLLEMEMKRETHAQSMQLASEKAKAAEKPASAEG